MIEIKVCVCVFVFKLAKAFCSEICLSRFCFCFTFFSILLMLWKKNGKIQSRVKLLDFTVDLLKCCACDPPFKVEKSSESEVH